MQSRYCVISVTTEGEIVLCDDQRLKFGDVCSSMLKGSRGGDTYIWLDAYNRLHLVEEGWLSIFKIVTQNRHSRIIGA